VALRRLRFAFDSYHSWDGVHVDQWLHYLLKHGSQELHLDLRFAIWTTICTRSHDTKDVDNASDSEDVRKSGFIFFREYSSPASSYGRSASSTAG
jgi:hypothetical protein